MVLLASEDTTVCTGLLLYGGHETCFTYSINIDTSWYVGSGDTTSQRGDSKSVHTDVFAEAGETDYVNTLVEKSNSMK